MVFNCSGQMTIQTKADVFIGLAQVGAWGCFDVFNRIGVEVLSVASTQFTLVLDGMRVRAKTLLSMNEDIRLVLTAVVFIAMSPGCAGRTKLP